MYALLATVFVFIFTLLFVLNWQKFRYWESKGVLSPPTVPLIGHLHQTLLARSIWLQRDKLYRTFKAAGYWGMYECFTPTFYVADPALLRAILVKDAEHFVDRRNFVMSEKDKLFGEMLHIQQGEKWKALRALMSPTFSSGKIKAMFPLIDAKCDALVIECEKEMDKNSYVEMKSVLGYYAMDVIATCAFGIEANCLEKKEESLFVKNANKLSIVSLMTKLKFIIVMISVKLFNALGLSFAGKGMDFFVEVVEETSAMRKKSGQKRGDFLDLMLEALDECNKNESTSKYPVTMDTVVAQSTLFLLAGFDTTANSLSFLVYLLAKHHDCQERLRKELTKLVEVDGELNYQNVMEAEFLDACVSETLRIYAPAHWNERVCTKEYNVPGTDIIIEKGTIVGFPIWSVHLDPDYWEEPESFQPDRFLPENKDRIQPYTYMPFGLGPRNCIGMRFALLETKLAAAKLILNFELALRPGFKEVVLGTTPATLRPNKDGVQLVLKKLNV